VATRIGTTLDRYVIDAELGRGAMGVVYRARDPKLGRTVAIKMVSTAGLDPEAEKEYRQRFVVEAHAAGRFSHPGIVTIFDVREDAEPYLVMEYVEGQSLQQLMGRENRPLPLSTTLRLVQEVAEALHYAHAQGVVHRDIKPANVLVTSDGHPKIADFGIAKLNQSEMTMPGQVLGSPAFMAPEQLSDEGVDSRSDLFSLGVILYYMLTGYRPFQGNSTTTVCFKLVNHEPVPASALESKLPPELDEIVSRAMAKDPADRYQTGMAMASDLQTLRERSGFVHSSDWNPQNLKRDAIPSYVRGTSAELSTAKRTARQQEFEQDIALKQKKALFSTTVIVFGVVAMVVAGVALWSGQSSRSKAAAPVEMQQPAGSSAAPGQPGVDGAKVITGQAGADKAVGENVAGDKVATDKDAPNKLKTSARRPKKASFAEAKAPIPPTPADATLQIEIEHHFGDATASVWLDDNLVYTQSLQGKKQRHALVFRKVVGHQFEVVRVAPGKHQVRVRVQSTADSYDQSKVASVAFESGVSLLRIICDDKGEGLQLDFKKDGYR
jgi:serine/threonine protein kinase